MKKLSIIIGIILLAGVGLVVFTYHKAKPLPAPIVTTVTPSTATLEDGRQCYTYSHDATTTEPYAVSEFIDITVHGATVTGTKTGTQKGPDMTNGYTGTLAGTVTDDILDDTFSYTIEGSHNQEKEIYNIRADKIGIEKLRYPLIDQGKMLVPDTTKNFTTLLYARVGCTASN